MATLTVQNAKKGLENVVMAAANGGGDAIPQGVIAGGWRLATFLLVRNADTTAKTVTVDGVAFVVPATTGTCVVPVGSGNYPGTLKTITYSAVTAVTVAAVEI